jgi:hypothetical protein
LDKVNNIMHTSWIFKPKYGKDIYERVIKCFANEYLEWENNGVYISLVEAKNGYVEMQATIDDASCHEFFAENCFYDRIISGRELTEDMMVLLIEAGVAWNVHEDEPEMPPEYTMEDVDICQVLEVLSKPGTSIYSPFGTHCWVYPVGDGIPKTVDIMDALLTLQAA